MATKATHDLAVKTGEYTDANGETRGRWLRLGTVFRHDDGGTSIKLDCLPVGVPEWDGWVSVFKREERQDASTQFQQPRGGNGRARNHDHAPSQAAPARFEDDIPF